MEIKKFLINSLIFFGLFILGLYCFFLAGTHSMVLTGMFTIDGMDSMKRQIYFSSDMFTALMSYIIVGSKTTTGLTIIHFIVHLTAVMHLLGNPFESYFYAEVFKLAEWKESSSIYIPIVYKILTICDITLHLINVCALGYKALVVIGIIENNDKIKGKMNEESKKLM
mgnify:CR=1 FL=1